MSPAPATPAERARSALFLTYLIASIAVLGVLFSPLLLAGRRGALRAIRIWARGVIWALRAVVGARVEIRGLEHRPAGAVVVAAKHQSELDAIAPFVFLADPAFVVKKELKQVPFLGWYMAVARMIPVDRAAHSAALRAMMQAGRERLADGMQVVIFPEGTRQAVGAPPDYKPGVAALYRELKVACTPLATNSGQVWPAKGPLRPGVVVFEFLPAIPAGLKRAEFMQVLEGRIETASNRLASGPPAPPP